MLVFVELFLAVHLHTINKSIFQFPVENAFVTVSEIIAVKDVARRGK